MNKIEFEKAVEILSEEDRYTMQKQIVKRRDELNDKLYLGELIKQDNVKFKTNNLILAPVGSGKSHLIENMLIPEGFKGKALYLTSNSALKDSICPESSESRRYLASKGKSRGFFTSGNKSKFGTSDYSVHVMTYHEFGKKIESPHQNFTDDIDLVFCDEIHSLPTYKSYDKSAELDRAMRWLFLKYPDKQIFYFTGTHERLYELERKVPGYLSAVTTYDYSEHPKIRRYVASTTVMITHIEQLRPLLKSKLESFNYEGSKGLAFTRFIEEQKKIYEIAKSEGFKPIMLWSIHNEVKMSEEQLRVRDFVLKSGFIPEPYNILIINSSMQEGWNLEDNMMRLAILDTLDLTEQIQSLGRIRKDIDLVICKTNGEDESEESIEIPSKYLNRNLTSEDKTALYIEMNVINKQGKVSKWPTIKKRAEDSGYIIADQQLIEDGKRIRVTTISIQE